jgi:peptidyl-prolyl cis-trans isomerase C
MLHVHLTLAASLLIGLTACGSGDKKGPLVAKGDGVAVSAAEFKARLDEQSPFIRQRYTTLERKKEFLDNLVRFEVLVKEAQKQGLDADPDVQQTLKKVMVQKLVQKTFNDAGVDATKEVPEADQKKYYDDHRDDYSKPKKVRLLQILLAAKSTDKPAERAAKAKQARELLAKIKTEEPKNPAFFSVTARERSEDQATKALGGDLGFKTQDDLGKLYGAPFAEAAFAAKDNDIYSAETPQGIHVVKVAGHQEAFDRTFDQVKAQIAGRLLREKRQKEFDEFVKKLREQAHVTVNDAELEKVAVAAAPQPPPGAAMPPGGPIPPGGLPPGHPPMSAAPGAPPPPPAVHPAAAAPPAPKP